MESNQSQPENVELLEGSQFLQQSIDVDRLLAWRLEERLELVEKNRHGVADVHETVLVDLSPHKRCLLLRPDLARECPGDESVQNDNLRQSSGQSASHGTFSC